MLLPKPTGIHTIADDNGSFSTQYLHVALAERRASQCVDNGVTGAVQVAKSVRLQQQQTNTCITIASTSELHIMAGTMTGYMNQKCFLNC